jgi:hypothetical protein
LPAPDWADDDGHRSLNGQVREFTGGRPAELTVLERRR